MSAIDHGRPYRTLDGLRGVAALLVVTRHTGAVIPWNLFPESFLAVDLFFLLSGFVVAHAYEARLVSGEPIGRFMRTRLIRLYPLYVLGLGLGLVAHLAQAASGQAPLDPVFLAQALLAGALMLPATPLFPLGGQALDGPTWTLLPELLVNLLYAALARRLTTRRVWALVAVGGIGVVAAQAAYGTLDGGWSFHTWPVIGARLVFSFFLGVGLRRARPVRRAGPSAALACVALLAVSLMLTPAPAHHRAYELVAVLGVFPALTALAVRREPGRLGARAMGFLGLVSYAVYVLHQPMGVLAGLACTAIGVAAPSWTSGLSLMIAVVVAAAVADRVYDTPVRRALTAATGRRRPERAPTVQLELTPGEA